MLMVDGDFTRNISKNSGQKKVSNNSIKFTDYATNAIIFFSYLMEIS